MTPRGLLANVATFAQTLKETYTADNGISDLRPSLLAFDAHGKRIVAVLLDTITVADVALDAMALVAAWQPWALAFVCEGYVRHYGDDETFNAEVERDDHDFARDFAGGDQGVHEAVIVAVHPRYERSVGCAMPFRYLTAHTVEWIEVGDLYEGEGAGGRYADVLESAIDVEPMPGVPLAAARIECIDFLRERGCLVVT